MLTELFVNVAAEVISYTIEKLGVADQIKTWLRKDLARLGFQNALARTYAAFARHYPEYTNSLFDEPFLRKEATPELAKLLIRNQHPDPALLAHAWARSIGAKPNFAIRAARPISQFLEWLEAELKVEAVFQPLFDSRALDSLPNIETDLSRLNNELAAAMKAASNYEQPLLKVQGDLQDANVILGDGSQINVSNIYNTYYTGIYDRLSDYYVSPDSVFQRVRVDEFVGRDWLTAKVDAFLSDPNRKSGAFLLVGDAGVGKTSFMARLVKERRYLHLFAEQVTGDANVQRALQSLGSQLVTRYQIAPYKDRDTLTQLTAFPDFLERLLRLAANTLTHGEKIVIVCDALDEAGTFPDGNVFGLPNVLPDGVYFILSQRPVHTKLPNFEPVRFDLEAQGVDNLQDMQTYLSAVAKRPEVAGQIRAREYSEAFFIQTLQEKSLGVWMYLHYIIKEIESGSRAPLDLEDLPTGLTGYYADYWDDWRYGRRGRGKGEDAWNSLYSPLLTTLAAAQEAITVNQLIEWADVKVISRDVAHLLSQAWRSFITEKENGKSKVFAPYHLSFRDFITGRVDLSKLDPKRESLVQDLAEQTVEAHVRIVKAFEEKCNGEWEKLVEQEYPRLHLSAHLAGAGQYPTLINLLTEGDRNVKWAEARYQKEETYVNYISDLAYVWRYAEQENDYALMIRCMLIENSIHSLAANIPPDLLAQLAKNGLWSYPRCLSTIRENSNSTTQAEALKLIAPDFPSELLAEALATARKIKDDSARAKALLALAPRLTDELKVQALVEGLTAAREIKGELARARAFSDLAPYLSDELKAQVLAEGLTSARENREEGTRASALSALAPHLTDDLKTQALAIAREINAEGLRAYAFSSLAPHLTDKLKVQALTAARKIKDEYARASTLSALVPHLRDELKAQAQEEGLKSARKIKDEDDRAHALSAIAPHLTHELKVQVLAEGLAAAREIMEEDDRAHALSALAPHLTNELKAQALAIASEIKSEDDRVSVLSALVPHLSDELKAQALAEGLAATREIKAGYAYAHALSAFAPHLTDELKAQVLTAARGINSENDRAHALSALVPYLTDDLKALALTAIREIKTEYTRAYALSALAPHLTDDLKAQVLAESLTAVREINADARADALSALVPHLTDDLKALALAAVCEIKEEEDRAYALSALAPHLTDDLKTQALTIACEIKAEYVRPRALSALVPYLTDELKTQALAAAREISAEDARASALSALAPHLSDELKAQALAATCEIKGEYDRGRALSLLVPHLTDDLKAQALAAACEIKGEYDRGRALSSLVPHLSDELKAQALAAACEIKGENVRTRALSSLVPHLADEMKAQALAEGLAAALEIMDEDGRAHALLALVPHLTDDLIARALMAAREIKEENTRARALSDLAPHLTEDLKAQALAEGLAAARKIMEEEDRADALSVLSLHLTDDLKTQALTAALEIKAEYTRAYALSALAPHLTDDLIARALTAAREIKDEYARSRALSALAPHLTDELKTQALTEGLAAVREIKEDNYRVHALSALAPHLTDDLKAQALTAAREIRAEYARTRALLALVSHLTGEIQITVLIELLYLQGGLGYSLAEAFKTWEDIKFNGLKENIATFIHFKSQMNREKGMQVVRFLTPALVYFRGSSITRELFRAIMDTTRWWP